MGNPDPGDVFNGNYYAYLTHGSDISILLNRVGVTANNPYGYPDSGFDITFSDGSYNIHDYQSTTYTLNGDGQLTGIWGPDGRNVSPFTVTDADSSSALLNAFDGQSANGEWTLFIADVSTLSEAELANWSLTVDGSGSVSNVTDETQTILLLLSVVALIIWDKRSAMTTSNDA